MPEQYEIISMCTTIPSAYNDILNTYLSTEHTVQVNVLEDRLNKLKSKSEQLSKYVDTYTTALHQPETYPVRRDMISSNEKLIQAFEKLRKNMVSQPQLDTAKKIAFASNDIRPALVDFQTACLAETKDIVNNMLADLKDNSNNID